MASSDSPAPGVSGLALGAIQRTAALAHDHDLEMYVYGSLQASKQSKQSRPASQASKQCPCITQLLAMRASPLQR